LRLRDRHLGAGVRLVIAARPRTTSNFLAASEALTNIHLPLSDRDRLFLISSGN
jgi:hypothetical protein